MNRRTPVACLLGPLASGINKLRASLAIPHSNETGAKPARTWTVTCVRVASGEFTRQLPSCGLTASDNKLSGNSGNSHRTLKNSLGQLKPRGESTQQRMDKGARAGRILPLKSELAWENIGEHFKFSTSHFPADFGGFLQVLSLLFIAYLILLQLAAINARLSTATLC